MKQPGDVNSAVFRTPSSDSASAREMFFYRFVAHADENKSVTLVPCEPTAAQPGSAFGDDWLHVRVIRTFADDCRVASGGMDTGKGFPINDKDSVPSFVCKVICGGGAGESRSDNQNIRLYFGHHNDPALR